MRIPANVDRDDRLLAGLTGRQLVVLGCGGGAAAMLWNLGASVVPAVLLGCATVPIAIVTVALAFGNLAGLTGDRAALAWLRFLRSPKRLVLAPEGLPDVPPWAPSRESLGELPFPVEGVDESGVVDLGPDGHALICRASSLNFGLRTHDEQVRLVAALGHWLNSLSGPVQIVVRAESVDLAEIVGRLRSGLTALPDPALEEAARDHAAFLVDLAGRHDVFRRVVLVVLRSHDRSEPLATLGRLAEDASAALASAGITLRPLNGSEVAQTLANKSTAGPAASLLPGEVLSGWCE